MNADDLRKIQLSAKMLVCSHTVRDLLRQIHAIEADTEATPSSRLEKIKKIKDEITKVGAEIDSLKREFTLLNKYTVN